MTIKDSGERTDFDSGAQRDCQEGKGRMDLLPMRALIEISKIYEAGAKKYAERNWEKGMPLSRYTDSGQRHLAKWLIGQDDENHLAMACWNFLCLLDTQLRIKDGTLPEELNDLPCNPDAKDFPCQQDEDDGDCPIWNQFGPAPTLLEPIVDLKIGPKISDYDKWLKASIACGSWAKEACIPAEFAGDSDGPLEGCEVIREIVPEDFEAPKTFSDILEAVDAEGERILAEDPPISDEVAMAAIVKEWPEHEGTNWAMEMKCKLQRALQDMVEMDIAQALNQIKPKSLKEWGRIRADLAGEPREDSVTEKMRQMGMTESCVEQVCDIIGEATAKGQMTPKEKDIATKWAEKFPDREIVKESDDLYMKPITDDQVSETPWDEEDTNDSSI